jgi:hypothetical protein
MPAEDPKEIGPLLLASAMSVVPGDEGDEPQRRLVESLAHGRVVVSSSHAAAATPVGAEAGRVPADDPAEAAEHIASLLLAHHERTRRERLLRAVPTVPTWERAAVPLVEIVGELLEVPPPPEDAKRVKASRSGLPIDLDELRHQAKLQGRAKAMSVAPKTGIRRPPGMRL